MELKNKEKDIVDVLLAIEIAMCKAKKLEVDCSSLELLSVAYDCLSTAEKKIKEIYNNTLKLSE